MGGVVGGGPVGELEVGGWFGSDIDFFRIVSAAVDSVKNDVLYISTPSAKTSILAAADIIIEKIHIVYMSTPSARTPIVARVVFWLTARTCIIRRTQLDARMACIAHANAARPVSIEEQTHPIHAPANRFPV